jgi:hypothetical protein
MFTQVFKIQKTHTTTKKYPLSSEVNWRSRNIQSQHQLHIASLYPTKEALRISFRDCSFSLSDTFLSLNTCLIDSWTTFRNRKYKLLFRFSTFWCNLFCASKYEDEHRYINFDCREKKHKNQGHQHCVSLGQVNTKMTRITAVKICRTSKEHNQQDFSIWWESR